MNTKVQAPPLLPDEEIQLTITTGPEKGTTYKLLGKKIVLGRAEDSDVVLQDVKASRHHARLENRNGDFWIVDLKSQNGIFVNGQPVRERQLKIGDSFLIGTTQFRFGVSLPPVPVGPTSSPLSAVPEGWLPPPLPQQPKISRPRQSSSSLVALVVALMIGAVAIILNYKSDAIRRSFGVKDDAAVEGELEAITMTNEKRQEEILKKGKDTQQYAEAQAFYLRGFREFRENNYGRAIQNFEAALALYPDHPLAKRYLDRSRFKLNETITASLERGEKAFQLERYNVAFNEYRTVLLLVGDPRNKSYQLAQKRIEAINLILMNNK